jgi:hypothetical protein
VPDVVSVVSDVVLTFAQDVKIADKIKIIESKNESFFIVKSSL